MELIRNLLFLIEEQETNSREINIPTEIDREQAVYHLKLMEQAGLTKNNIKYAGDKPFWIYSDLTWAGHDFLDSVKNDTIWTKVKEGIKSKGLELGQVSFGILIEYAKSEIKTKLGLESR
jgi:hypothetical protein